jgi:hypothetical protein
MIPDFKTYIGESAWGEMRHRSSGMKIRKEDDVNLMDKDTLYNYIMSTYGDMCISVNNLDEYILVKIVRGYELSLHYKNNKIDEILSDGFDFGDSSEFDTKFKIVKEEKALYKIFNLNGTVTNKTALDFIEFYYKNVIGDKEFDLLKKLIKEFVNSSDEYSLNSFCDYIKTKKSLTVNHIIGRLIYFIKNNEDFYSDEISKVTKGINESAWGEMRRRSSGEQIRKEDDLDNLSFEEFYEYLRKKYTPKTQRLAGNKEIGHRLKLEDMDVIQVIIPIEEVGNFCKSLVVEYSKTTEKCLRVRSPKSMYEKYDNLKRFLDKKYDIKDEEGHRLIIPKAGKLTNNNIVELINIFLLISDNPLLKKNS